MEVLYHGRHYPNRDLSPLSVLAYRKRIQGAIFAVRRNQGSRHLVGCLTSLSIIPATCVMVRCIRGRTKAVYENTIESQLGRRHIHVIPDSVGVF